MLGRRIASRGGQVVTTALALLVACVLAGCAVDRSDSSESAVETTAEITEETAPPTTGEPQIAQSIYRVKANRCASPENSWTTGFAIDSQTIVTVAHALISTLGVTVIDADDVEHAVEIAYVDDEKDIALLRLVEGSAEAVAVAGAEASGDVWIVTFKQKDEHPVVRPASVLALLEVTMEGQGARDAIKLTADISVGDSGGPVVNSSGELLGMIFATTIDEQTGWAIAEPEVSRALDLKNANRPEVVPPACTSDPTDPEEPAAEDQESASPGNESN